MLTPTESRRSSSPVSVRCIVTNYSSLLHFYDFSIVFFVYFFSKFSPSFVSFRFFIRIWSIYMLLPTRPITNPLHLPLKKTMDSSSSAQQPLMDGWSNIASLDQQQQTDTKQKAKQKKKKRKKRQKKKRSSGSLCSLSSYIGPPMAFSSRVIPFH